jgi:gamma-glutamyltranspeptidase
MHFLAQHVSRFSGQAQLEDGAYSFMKHHHSYWSVGVPGTVAGLYLAWQDHGSLP